MRTVLFLFLILCGPAFAGDETCVSLAESLASEHSSFPAIEASSAAELVTWRASCAETPPQGPGNVVALCQAVTENNQSVFYWSKDSAEGGSSGYSLCP